MKKQFLILTFVCFLVPSLALAVDVTIDWDGQYIRAPSAIPAEFSVNPPGPAPDSAYAKLSIRAQTDCAVASPDHSTELRFGDRQPGEG